MRGVPSLAGDCLVVFYCRPYKRGDFILLGDFAESDLIRVIIIIESGLIRGMTIVERGLTGGGSHC